MMKKIKKFSDLLFYLVANFEEEGVVETKLMKLLYFAEANYYKNNRETITGVDYFKNIYGPTPDIKVLNKTKKELKNFLSVKRKPYNEKYITVYKITNKDYSYNSLTEKEMEEAGKTFELYNRLPSGQLSKISHLDPPYLAAEKKIDFRYVSYRKDSEEDYEPAFSLKEGEKFKKDLSRESLGKLFDYAKKIS